MNEKFKNLREFDPTSYDPIDLDRLIIYTAVELERVGIELSLENIIVGAFKLFPKKFSLLGFPEFPDATRVEKSLWRCKGNKRQWIGGKTLHGYLITDKTRIIARQTEEQITNPTLRKQKVASRMRRKDSIMRDVTESPAYKKYINGRSESITEAEFCYLLQGTLDSTRETLSGNQISLKEIAKELKREDVLQFLNWIENRFKDFLHNKIS